MAHLKLYLLTFNCGRTLVEPDVFGQHLLDGWQDPTSFEPSLPDVIVLNLQEIAPLSHAFLGGNLVKPYFDRFRQVIQMGTTSAHTQDNNDEAEYVNIITRNCGLTALMVFVRAELADNVHTLSTAEVGVGVSEMANKGAIGVRAGWKVPRSEGILYTTFVSAHLAAFEEEMERRDQDYKDIVQGLVFSQQVTHGGQNPTDSEAVIPLLSDSSSENHSHDSVHQGIYADDSYLFVSGDLNYRTGISGPTKNDSEYFPQPSKDTESPKHFSHLLEKDQLTQQLQAGKTLHGLKEQRIQFPPTYKYRTIADKPVILDEDSNSWQWSDHRWPSWCDRILFAATSTLPVQAGKYSALPIFRTSDHRPVVLSAAIPLQPVSGSKFSKETSIVFDLNHQTRRSAARRKEIAVGLIAYLGLTWEGNALLFGTTFMILGAIYISKSMA